MADSFPFMVPGAVSSGEKMVWAPYDGAEIAAVPLANGAAVDKALDTASRLFKDRDGWLSVEKRIDILEKTAELMLESFDKLAVEAAREGGKPLPDSQVEVARAIDGVKLCIETLRTQHGSEIPMGLNASSMNRIAVTTHEPIGVVVAVSAFNHPLNLIVHQVAPAIAVGCPCIVKPAEVTPLSCIRFVQMLHEAGLPEEWCQVVVTDGREVSEKLVTDSRVGFFSFIGSPGVGWMLRSKLAPGTRCALEHGGAAPVIVAPDADLDVTMPLLAKGGFYHAGQVCVSVQRVFAHDSIAREVAAQIGELGSKMPIGDPTLASTEIGPLIRTKECDRVAEWIKAAADSGAEIVAGGHRVSDSCHEATVLYNPPTDALVSQREIFGPAVCVYPYSDIDEAIGRANSLPYIFQAAVCTKDMDTAMRCFRRLDASAVMVNDHTAFRVDWMPFAGLRQSGYNIGGIHHTIHDMQIEKMLVIRSPEL
ncbi:MAG: aldehyde dehydrogenase family protein [Alphaproteobacteria bacterium]|mgnify:FL=1|jgi:acyl-CoA reductase-like NAD-dependent aldehyde dehydrogenase